jgi:hypothetical protein
MLLPVEIGQMYMDHAALASLIDHHRIQPPGAKVGGIQGQMGKPAQRL